MTTISRTSFEAICRVLTRPRSVRAGPNEAHLHLRELTAEQKALFTQLQPAKAPAEKSVRQEIAAGIGLYPAEATYTKWGNMSTDEEKEAFVQWKLDMFDLAQAVAENRRQEIEKTNTDASTGGQSGNAEKL